MGSSSPQPQSAAIMSTSDPSATAAAAINPGNHHPLSIADEAKKDEGHHHTIAPPPPHMRSRPSCDSSSSSSSSSNSNSNSNSEHAQQQGDYNHPPHNSNHNRMSSAHKVKKGLWSPDEDEKLRLFITTHGHSACWSSIPKLAGIYYLFIHSFQFIRSTFAQISQPQPKNKIKSWILCVKKKKSRAPPAP